MLFGSNPLKPLCAALVLALAAPAIHAADADILVPDAGTGPVLDKVDVTATSSSYST